MRLRSQILLLGVVAVLAIAASIGDTTLYTGQKTLCNCQTITGCPLPCASNYLAGAFCWGIYDHETNILQQGNAGDCLTIDTNAWYTRAWHCPPWQGRGQATGDLYTVASCIPCAWLSRSTAVVVHVVAELVTPMNNKFIHLNPPCTNYVDNIDITRRIYLTSRTNWDGSVTRYGEGGNTTNFFTYLSCPTSDVEYVWCNAYDSEATGQIWVRPYQNNRGYCEQLGTHHEGNAKYVSIGQLQKANEFNWTFDRVIGFPLEDGSWVNCCDSCGDAYGYAYIQFTAEP